MKHWNLPLLLFFLAASFSSAQLSVVVDGDTVRILDANVDFACLASFFPIVRQSNDTLYLTECDTAFHAPCKCLYDLCTSITGLAPGNYTAVVARDYRRYYSPDSFRIVYSQSAGTVAFSVLRNSSASISFYQSACLSSTDVALDRSPIHPSKIDLQIFPNPFNPATIIEFRIIEPSPVNLAVYNLSGQLIANLVDEYLPEGVYRIPFDAHDLSSGAYVCRLRIADQVVAKQMLSVK